MLLFNARFPRSNRYHPGADSMSDAWQLWLEWQRVIAPDNRAEIAALEKDRGDNLTHIRAIARRRADVTLDEPITSVPTSYTRQPLLRDP